MLDLVGAPVVAAHPPHQSVSGRTMGRANALQNDDRAWRF
jgi:hypothetical protein